MTNHLTSIIPTSRNLQENKLVDISKDGKPVTTSLIIANRFGKRHQHVLRDVENLECSEKFGQSNFGQSSYINLQNKKQPMYLITRDGFTLLAMGFTGKKAMQWKEKYIAAFNEMEEHIKGQPVIQLSKNDSDAMSYLLSAVDTIKIQMGRLTEIRKYEDSPVAPFCDDQCLYKAGGFILKDSIYNRYEAYCYVKEEYPLTKPVFFRKLYKYAGFVKAVKRTINGKPSYGITGFRLKGMKEVPNAK